MKDWLRRHQEPRFRSDEDLNRDIPDNLWLKCARCGEMLYQRELEDNDYVCPKCSNHFRLRARQRIELLADPGSFEEHAAGVLPSDPLGFVSNGESYAEKLAKTQRKTGLPEAVVTGTALIHGHPVVLAVSDFTFLGASMGSVFGEKIVRAVDIALERGQPVLTVSASGGARMHEGVFSLMQMAKTTAAFAELGRRGLPHISLLTDPCFGGVTASYATIGDVILAEPGALIGFAGPRVIEQITRQKLPPGFQTAEFLLEHGMIDMVVPRRELRDRLSEILSLFQSPASANVAD